VAPLRGARTNGTGRGRAAERAGITLDCQPARTPGVDARRLPIFSGWAAAGLASTLVRSGDLDAAEGYVDQVFREGTPTTHYEGRLAEVELAVARQDPEAASLAARALDLAEDGGLLQSAARLRCLLAACAGSGGDGHAGQTPTEAGASDRRVG